MKSKLLIFSLLVFFSLSSIAQTQKGSVLLGGMAGFNYSKSGDYKVTSVQLAPIAHIFVIDQLSVGGGVGIGFSSSKYGSGDSYNATSLAVSPAVRYYFGSSGNTRPFGTAQFQWASVKVEDEDAESGIGFGAGVGIDFFLNNHVAIEGILGYQNFKFSDADDSTGTFGLNFGVVAFIGGGSD